MADKIDHLVPDLFKDGPAEYLTKHVADAIRSEPHFKAVFGESVVDYDKEDFSMRELPALRVYNFDYTKETESHYIIGDIHMDVIFPASIRREQTEEYQSRIANALLQQFRRPNFFEDMKLKVPGLNELGKVFRVQKNLGFQNTGMSDECPATHIVLNFRLDQKVWDAYLESQGRTKDEPFDKTLENLREIAAEIAALREDGSTQIVLNSQQTIGGN